MPDGVRKDQIPLGQVERLARSEERAFEIAQDPGPAASSWVQDENGVVDDARRIPVRGAESDVVQPQFRKYLATLEVKVRDGEVTFGLSPQDLGCALFGLR